MPNNKHTTPTDPLVSSSSIEITHDILAKKIYARIDADEKMRLKITQMLRDRHTYYLETGELLSKRDLAYIDPYLGQVETSEIQEAFIQKSRKAVKASENRRRMIIAGIGAILIAAAAVSIWFGIDARKQARIADEKTRETKIALKNAQESDSLAQLEKANAIASAEEASKAKKTADSLADIAQQNLANFQKATESIVAEVLKDAQQDIYKLRYAEAHKKYRDSYKYEKFNQEVAKGMMELAFFYHETGQPQLAYGLADTAATLLGKPSRMRGTEDLLARLQRMQPDWYEDIHNRYYPKMIFVEGGAFKYQGEKDTTLSDFYIGEMEVSVWQYNLYALAEDSIEMAQKPSWGYDGDNPVIYVNWYDAKKYAGWLSAKTGDAYQLPGEVEWEYAARGGKKSRGYTYSGSATLDSVGWYNDNSESRTNPVKKKNGNELGLYDMSGNVYEWCADSWSSSRSNRVFRGGGWYNNASNCRVGFRYRYSPYYRNDNIGYRLTRTR